MISLLKDKNYGQKGSSLVAVLGFVGIAGLLVHSYQREFTTQLEGRARALIKSSLEQENNSALLIAWARHYQSITSPPLPTTGSEVGVPDVYSMSVEQFDNIFDSKSADGAPVKNIDVSAEGSTLKATNSYQGITVVSRTILSLGTLQPIIPSGNSNLVVATTTPNIGLISTDPPFDRSALTINDDVIAVNDEEVGRVTTAPSGICENYVPGNGTLARTEVRFYFSKTADCNWGSNGNLNERQQYTVARKEEYRRIQLPGAPCHLRVISPTQDQKYDDNLLVTINGKVILTTEKKLTAKFNMADGFPIYDWQAIKGMALRTGTDIPDNPDCFVGANACDAPSTQRLGPFGFDVNESYTQKLFPPGEANDYITMGIITTGDNDSSDCSHKNLNAMAEIFYVIPNQD